VQKENYRTRITSFNNPMSSDMGFSLEAEVMTALKPLLAKAKTVDGGKFQQVVSSLVNSQSKSVLSRSVSTISPVFPTLVSLVGSLAVQEKKITKDDLDSFILSTSRYFVQYEKLNVANHLFDQQIAVLVQRLKDLQFDLREYVLDMCVIIQPGFERNAVKSLGAEEIFLRYLNKVNTTRMEYLRYPADGIKIAKEISHGLQKLFSEYLKIYADNYLQIRQVLNESRTLSKRVNLSQLDLSISELQSLYNESRTSDLVAIRFETLISRLNLLIATEQKR
jgi:hypothetical protein